MNEIFKIKNIEFDFRNKYKYAEETESLKRALPTLIPYLENYLFNKNLIDQLKEQVKLSNNKIHFAITDPKIENKSAFFGSVAYDNKKKDLIIILRMIPGADDSTMKFELMKTMIHEIFHLFIEGEESVRESVDEFIYSFDFEDKKHLLELLISKEKVNEIIENIPK